MVATVLEALNLPVGSVLSLMTSSLPGGSLRLQAVAAPASLAPPVLTPLATVGAGTLTGAIILTRGTLRTGPTTAFTDTTDTAANIQAAWTTGQVGAAFDYTYINQTAFAATIAAGSGVTLAGPIVVAPNSTTVFRVVWTGAGAVTMTALQTSSNVNLPNCKLSTLNATAGVLPAGAITGANEVYLSSTNATPGAQTTRTAAQMLADTPNAAVGFTWTVRIINTGAGTFTLTADGSVTLTGHAAILTNTWVDYICTFLTATTASITSIGAGTSP